MYEGYFKISFVFGEKAVKVIEVSDISTSLINALVNARKYAEGRGISIDVSDVKYLKDIEKLIRLKIEN